MKTTTKPAKEPDKRPPGRPAFKPTKEQRDLVAGLSGLGVPQEGIATMVKDADGEPISVDTLTRHFRKDLDRGVLEANTKVAGTLYKMAISGENSAATFFWLKTRARWKETPQQHAFTDPDGNPLPPPSLGDFYKSVEKVKEGSDAS